MEYGVLGPLAAWKDGRELRLGGAKQRSVLAILLLRANELVPTETLVDQLWGERPPPTAVKAVQVHVSQLRKELGDGVLETRPTGYLLRVEPATLDAQRFERLLEQGRRLLAEGAPEEASRLLREALGLWRGPPLADFRYESFARNEIGRLEELRLVAIEQRLEADLALGRGPEVVGGLEALVRDHPLRESLVALLMLALYRAGRQADALAAYQDARARLLDELGLDPSQSLQRLEKSILLQDASLELPVAAPVPPPGPEPEPAERREGVPAPGKPAVEARKTVTVLFCDVLAAGTHGERLDPETLQLVMSRFFESGSAVLERHGGSVERVVGDDVRAVFGVPVVREDDALRAVRAAVELRDCAAALDLAAGIRLHVRIGVSTGEVVAGDPAAGHGVVSGDALGVGRRLEEAAAPAEILLAGETYALVAHAVEVTPVELPSVEGKRPGVAAFRLASVDPEATAIPRRDDAPFVGREPELARLRELYADVTGGSGARMATVVGEPGIGKSRLARAFMAGLGSEATVLVGRCPPYGEDITFRPVRELLRQAGRDDAALAGSSHEVFAAVRHVLEEIARERPLVAAFDDVHWAEPTFLDFIEYLAGRLGDAQVLLLCLTRPQLVERRPAWLQEPAVAVVLEPLSEAESETLLEALGAPPAVRRRIAEAAEGNPLFVEQLAAIADEDGTAGEMPGSIRGVLHERLDKLDPEERSALERASVSGRSFSLEAVLHLTPPDERESVNGRLLALVRKRFVRPDTAAPEEGFRFHHALIRDAAYDGIPKSIRAELHERAAERLEAQAAETALIGRHLEQAFGLRRDLGNLDDELGARAGRLLRAAGREAFARSDLPATVSFFERAHVLLPAMESAQLLPEHGEALFEAGRLTEARAVLADAIERADGDPLLESRARVEREFVELHAESTGAIAEAREIAAAALAVFEEHDNDLGQSRAACLRAWVEWNLGHAGAADEAWQRAASHAQTAGEERALFKILGWRASASLYGPAPVVEAIRTCAEIRARVLTSRVAVAVTLRPLGALHAMLGDFDEARSLVREANAILDDVGRMQSAVSHHAALVETLAGDHAAAERQLREGYERLEEMGEKALLATTAAMLAQATYAQERYREAETFCSVSERLAASEDFLTQVILRGVRAKILARQGRIDAGEALARDALRLVAQTDLITHRGDALLDLAEVLRLGDRTGDADEAVREAVELYAAKGNDVSAGLARSLVATPASI